MDKQRLKVPPEPWRITKFLKSKVAKARTAFFNVVSRLEEATNIRAWRMKFSMILLNYVGTSLLAGFGIFMLLQENSFAKGFGIILIIEVGLEYIGSVVKKVKSVK